MAMYTHLLRLTMAMAGLRLGLGNSRSTLHVHVHGYVHVYGYVYGHGYVHVHKHVHGDVQRTLRANAAAERSSLGSSSRERTMGPEACCRPTCHSRSRSRTGLETRSSSRRKAG